MTNPDRKIIDAANVLSAKIDELCIGHPGGVVMMALALIVAKGIVRCGDGDIEGCIDLHTLYVRKLVEGCDWESIPRSN